MAYAPRPVPPVAQATQLCPPPLSPPCRLMRSPWAMRLQVSIRRNEERARLPSEERAGGEAAARGAARRALPPGSHQAAPHPMLAPHRLGNASGALPWRLSDQQPRSACVAAGSRARRHPFNFPCLVSCHLASLSSPMRPHLCLQAHSLPCFIFPCRPSHHRFAHRGALAGLCCSPGIAFLGGVSLAGRLDVPSLPTVKDAKAKSKATTDR